MATLNFDFGIPSGNVSETAWSGYANGKTIAVVLGGTPIPLILMYTKNFTWYTTGTVVPSQSGTYLISYNINTTASLLMSAAVYRNGAGLTSLTSAPGIAANNFSGCSVVNLTAGDELQLMLYGLLGTAVLAGGAGANLNIVRLA